MSIPVMKIPWDAKGTFRSRPNRFLGMVDITSPRKDRKKGEEVHIHDPGRLKELLYPGNQVLLKRATSGNRKTKWDIIVGLYCGEWILVHSGYHRRITEWLIINERFSPFNGIKTMKTEARLGHSRIDFLLVKDDGKEIWVEVKGCTLARDGVALFPDAPTQRGRRHLQVLISLKEGGSESAIIILVFRPDAKCFAPNDETDPEFSKLFYSALEVGVEVHTVLFKYEDGVVSYIGKIPICKEYFPAKEK